MKLIDADDVMERIEQAYEDMGVDTHGIWNKQLAEIFKTADVEDIRMCLHKILGAVAQSPKIDRPQGEWIDMGDFEKCSVCKGTHLKEFQSYYGKVTWIKTPYCPQCGARMKGADDE